MIPRVVMLGILVTFGLMFGDDIDRWALLLGLLFALSMSGQEGLES